MAQVKRSIVLCTLIGLYINSGLLFSNHSLVNAIEIDKNAIHESRYHAANLWRNATADEPWENVGPNGVGRVNRIAVDPTDDSIVYIGAASGGFWKSIDGGETFTYTFFKTISGDPIESQSIGDIAIAPSDPKQIWVGTGENICGGGDLTYPGAGVYKSNDYGETWTYKGLPNSYYIGRISVHPTDTNTVFVAVMGTLFGGNEDRGVYRSKDGGATWSKVKYVDDTTGCLDVLIHPNNPNTVFACFWKRNRQEYGFDYEGNTSRIWRSDNGGDTWAVLGSAAGLPETDLGKNSMCVAESDPNYMYILYLDATSGIKAIYKSINGGTSWSQTSVTPPSSIFNNEGYRYGQIRVNPNNLNEVVVFGITSYNSTNGGSSWSSTASGTHAGGHDAVWSRQDANTVYYACDGGVYKSTGGLGGSFSLLGNKDLASGGISIAQVYTMDVASDNANYRYAGLMDNGGQMTSTGSQTSWSKIVPGNGMYMRVDQGSNEYVIGAMQNGGFYNSSNSGANMGGIADITGRKNWCAAIAIDSTNGKSFLGDQYVHRANRGSGVFSSISYDLTDGDHSAGVFAYGTVVAIDANNGVAYAGTDDGNVWVNTDANSGSTWQQVHDGVGWIRKIKIDQSVSDGSTAYFAISTYRWGKDKWAPKIFKTTDFGQNWTDISGDLPAALTTNEVLVDNNIDRIGWLYCATDLGVYYSCNSGVNWTILGSALPLLPCNDLVLHKSGYLYVGTYGRGLWRIDLSKIETNINVKPELFDTNGTDTDLPVSLHPDGSDTVDIYYQLFDKDSTIDTVSAQYRNGTHGNWVSLTNTAGNIGPVSGTDSSIHRYINWYAPGQLTNSFESDSVQVRIIASDPKGLSDTLSMANANLALDFKVPDTVAALTAVPVSPTEIKLTWTVSTSSDVDSQLVIYGTSAVSTINDTTGNTWFMLADTVDSISATGLTTDTKYYFAVFVRDEVPNWSSGSFTTGTTPNVPPVCAVDQITAEQSDSVTITFSLSDTENDTLSIACSYSTDGATWTNTSIAGVPAAIPDSLYSGGKKLNAIWPSKAVLPDRYIDSLYFQIIPSDNSTGTADTILFQLDNYHSQSIALTTPTGVQSSNVVIPFTVTDTSGDSISFSCSYSIDGGANWDATQNVNITKVGPAGYSGNITWSSAADIGIQDIPTVQFRIVPYDGWQNGTAGTTNNFHVNNSNIPLVIEIIQQPVVLNDTVTVAVRITAPNYSAITIDNSSYSIDDGAHVTATLTTGYIIQSTSYDSTVIIWASKQNYTSNSSNVKLHFTFKADTNSQQLTTQSFALNNNEFPSIMLDTISDEQNGDVDVSFTISDLDYDTIKVFAQYSEDGIVWAGATVSGDTSGIDSSKYGSASITWKSGVDFPDALQKTFWFKITPFDEDTGSSDSIQITITNQGIPSCDPLTLPEGDTLSDSITIAYILSDKDDDSLSITLYYSSDTGWVETGNVSGKTTGILPLEYSGSLVWLSKSDLPNTLVPDMKLKLVPNDKNFTGQSGESRQFILGNNDSVIYKTGDFNKDDKVDFLDFSYVSEYWYKSANGINHPDSIQELAPATGVPPYLTVTSDSRFNYEDLSVFIQMYYWSLENNEQDIITLATLENQYPDNITAEYKTDFPATVNKDNITIYCNVKEVSDLVSCRYILFYNPEILAYNSFNGDDKFLEEEKGDIFSRVQKEKGKIDIGMTRLASNRYSVSGSGTISDIIFTRKSNRASEVIICYTLINSEHDEIESGIAQVEIPAYENIENSLVITPNPSKAGNRNIPLELINNENAIHWIKNEEGGFVFRFSAGELSAGKSIKASIHIFDALGNLVNNTTGTGLYYNNGKPLDIYWNGYNKHGRKIGSGIYKLVFTYEINNNKNTIVRNLGIIE